MFDDAERGFIREILADPEAAAPRYRYADWLEQQSDPRAEAVRVGVERMAKQWERMFDLDVDLRLEELERRQKNLNIDYSRKVLEQLQRAVHGGDVDLGELSRHLHVDGLRRDVSLGGLNGFKNELTLRR